MLLLDMAHLLKMGVLFNPMVCSLTLVLLLPLSMYAKPAGEPEFINITRLSTYTLTSPQQNAGADAPQSADSAADATGADLTTGKANDSSAQASESGRSFPVGYKGRHPSDILGKPSGEGHWATPAPHSAIVLPFVPLKLYSQVRHTYEVNHRPRSDAVAAASTPEELAAAARLRESIQTKKISEVYSEEGYEDSAYDHAGFAKDAGFSEGHEGHEGGKKKKGHVGGSGVGEYDGPSGAASNSEDQKYPFHKVAPSDAVPRLSPLRYALNPASGAIPSKTSGGTEFYDSTDSVECPTVVELPSIPGREFRRPPEDTEEGESAENKDGEPKLAPTPAPPPTPRLKGLGDKIDCLRTKFFGGQEPLDNPFFKEQVVNVAKNEIRKAKAEQSRIKEEIAKEEKDKPKGEESKREEKVETEVKSAGEKQPHRSRQKSSRGYAAGFESYDPTAAAASKSEKRNATKAAVVETVGEDRMGEEAEDTATSGVGAAVEVLPSAAASDSDMQGFYADIMGHIQSATGNIVRQAYSGRNNNGNRSRRIRPPKAPRPPIIGYLDEREPFPASVYPSVLPPPNNFDESANRHAEADDAEEDEEYAGSERDEAEEEDEDDHQHHHHHHPQTNIFGGAQRVILRPINPQSQRYNSGVTGGGSNGGNVGGDAPFRPSPLMYVQSHPAPQRVPTHTHSSHHSSADVYMHHHHHHPHSGEPHSHRHHHSPGIRTFLVPAGSRPVPRSPPPMGQHYHINSIGGLRGSGTLLIPTPSRHTSTTPAYPGISLYPSRSPYPSLKRQSPVGQEFDGLLTATTQSVTTLAAPSNFRKYRGQQTMVDMVASSSSVSNSFSPPRNIEYFTLKDSLPHSKTPSVLSKLLPPESETLIPQITFTTTEKYSNSEKQYPSSNVAPLPPVGAHTVGAEVSQAYDPLIVESATQEYLHGEYESTESTPTLKARSTATSDATLQAAVLSTAATKLVTEEVAKGVVRAAIEEGAKKRRKNLRITKINDSITSEAIETFTQRPRNKRRRKNRFTLQNTNAEEILSVEKNTESGSNRWDKRDQQVGPAEDSSRAVVRTITSRGERSRKGDRGASRIRVGLTDVNGRNERFRGRKRGEPGYNSPSDDDLSTATKMSDTISHYDENTKSDRTKRSTINVQQGIQRRTSINPRESLAHKYSSEDSTEKEGSSRLQHESSRDQSSSQAESPLKEAIPHSQLDVGNIQNPSAQIEEPRKMFIEPRIRGDGRRAKIPRKVVTRSRSQHRIRVTTGNNDDSKNTGSHSPGRQRRVETVSSDPASKRWDVSKRRTLSPIEGVREERNRGNQRETERESPHTELTSNRSTSSRVDSRNNPNNPRVMRHREIKETLTAVYAPEE